LLGRGGHQSHSATNPQKRICGPVDSSMGRKGVDEGKTQTFRERSQKTVIGPRRKKTFGKRDEGGKRKHL